MPMSPVTTMVSAMDVITEELWIMAVNSAPRSTSKTGLRMPARNVLTPSRAAKDSMEPLISSKPTNSRPKPARIPPTVL